MYFCILMHAHYKQHILYIGFLTTVTRDFPDPPTTPGDTEPGTPGRP